MTKFIEVKIDLTPDDIVEYIAGADSQFQSAVIRKLARIYYRKPETFCSQLSFICDDIKENYDHDIQNNIKNMIKTLEEYICEVDNNTIQAIHIIQGFECGISRQYTNDLRSLEDIRKSIIQEIEEMDSYEIADAKYSDAETRKTNVDSLIEAIKNSINRNLGETYEE